MPSSMDAEGVELSSSPSSSTKEQAPHGNSEALSRQSIQAPQVIEQLALPEVLKLADEHLIVWCRLKGFPAWPVSYTALFHLHVNSNCYLASVCEPAVSYWRYQVIVN